jgi:hypothetical protein
MKTTGYTIQESDADKLMIRDLQEKYGYRTKAEIYRAGLRSLYKKESPAYQRIAEQRNKGLYDEFTPQDYCTKVLGGEVQGDHCVINYESGLQEKIPLANVKQHSRKVDDE